MNPREVKLAVATALGSNIYPATMSCFLDLAGKLRSVYHPASEFVWLEGGPYLVQNRTYLLRSVIMRDYLVGGFDYMLWVDADQIFGFQHIHEIVDWTQRNELDAAAGIYFNRHGTRHTMGGRLINEHDDIYWLRSEDLNGEVATQTPVPIDACGFGFLLVDMRPLREYCGRVPRGEWFKEHWHGAEKRWYSGEDVTFCRQWKEMGFGLHLAPHIVVGHYGGIVPETFPQSVSDNRFEEVRLV